MPCSTQFKCTDDSVPQQVANVGTLCGECRTEIEKALRRLGTGQDPTNFGGYLEDYVKMFMVLESKLIFGEKIEKFAKACKPGLFEKSHGLSHYLKRFETRCHFPDVEVVPTGVLSTDEFYDMIARGVMWKDVGAGLNHGLYSHRLQWHVVMAVVTADFTTPKANGWDHGAYDLFVSLGSGDAKRLNIWGKVFDASATKNFRAPESVEPRLTNKFVRGLIDDKYGKYQKIFDQILRYAGDAAAKKAFDPSTPKPFNANRFQFDITDRMWATYYFTQRNILPASAENIAEFEQTFGVTPKPKDKSKRYTDKTIVFEHGGKILRLNNQTMPLAADVAVRRTACATTWHNAV